VAQGFDGVPAGSGPGQKGLNLWIKRFKPRIKRFKPLQTYLYQVLEGQGFQEGIFLFFFSEK
jgi:hypothetical protein